MKKIAINKLSRIKQKIVNKIYESDDPNCYIALV